MPEEPEADPTGTPGTSDESSDDDTFMYTTIGLGAVLAITLMTIISLFASGKAVRKKAAPYRRVV